MRGAGRPAARAAAVRRGTVWVSSVFGPVIQVIVPSASRPVMLQHGRAERGDQERHGRGVRHLDRASITRTLALSFTGSPRSSGTSTSRYSRMWRAGFS